MSHDVNTSNACPTSATVLPAKLRILLACGVKAYDGMAGKATDLPAWSPEGFAAMGLFKEAFKRQLDESGESIEARALAAPLHTRRLGVQSSLPFVIDGPYAEARDVLAGYWIMECDRFGPATKLQAGLRAVRHQNMSSPTGMPTCGRSWKSAAEVSVSDEGR